MYIILVVLQMAIDVFFLADEFGAKDIILVGMCFGKNIGPYSKSKLNNPSLKKKK